MRVPETVDSIVNRATQRRLTTIRTIWRWGRPVVTALAAFMFFLTALIYRDWIHAHRELFIGILIGSLLQVPGWLRDRWLWMKHFSWQ
jgi:hypothetical protein